METFEALPLILFTFCRHLVKLGFRNGPVGVKPWTCRTLPFVLSGSWPSEVEPPQHLAAGYLLPYVVSAEAAYMMRLDRGNGEPIWCTRDSS